MKVIEKQTTEEIVACLISGDISINDLDMAKADHRDALVAVMETRPSILKDVNSAKKETVLNYIIEKNHELFVYLNNEQYYNEIAQMFLYGQLTASENKKSGKGTANASFDGFNFTVQKSIDEKILLTCLYTTPADCEIYYNDKKLGIPLSLKSSAKFLVKIEDAVKMIKKIDLNVSYLGENKIKHLISELIAIKYNAYLADYLSKNEEGYYSVLSSFPEIEAGLLKHLNNELTEYGILLTSVVIKKIAIPQELQEKIENLAFDIRQRNAEMEADANLARISLENYKAKLELQSKYPETDHSLTEYEKDLALKRYLIKKGRYEQEVVDRSIYIKKADESADNQINKIDEVIPEIAPEKSNFKGIFFTISVIAAIIFIIFMAAKSFGAGFIFLGSATLLLGVIAAFNTKKFVSPNIEPENNATVENMEIDEDE